MVVVVDDVDEVKESWESRDSFAAVALYPFRKSAAVATDMPIGHSYVLILEDMQ